MASDCSVQRSRGILSLPLAAALLAPVGLWAILLAIVPPGRQDFPLNDDWCHARGLFAFAHGDGIHYYRWTSVVQLGLWSLLTPFVWLVGESHVFLRLSTLFFGLLGAAAFFDLLRHESKLSARQAAFVAAALLLNPLFFVTMGTFMTDVPALALSLVALALYARALHHGRLSLSALAGIVACLAVLTRQNAIVVPVVAGLLLWRHLPARWRLLWSLPVLLPIGIGLAAAFWLKEHSDLLWVPPLPSGPDRVAGLLLVAPIQLGLASLPVLALRPEWGGRRRFLASGFFLLAVTVLWMGYRMAFLDGGLSSPTPYFGNMITPWGAFGSYVNAGGRPPQVVSWKLLPIIGLACGLAATLLLTRLPNWFSLDRMIQPLPLFTLLQVPLLLLAPAEYDRYLLVLMPGALALAASAKTESARLNWPAGFVVLAGSALLSLALMHDWLAWNAARWELGRRALAQGIDASEIEGGIEWDGWFSPYPAVHGESFPPRGLMVDFNREHFPHISGRYALSFLELPGSVRLDAEPYSLWLAPGPRQFFLLEETPRDPLRR